MLYEMFRFEFRSRMKKISTYIYFGIFFFFAFMMTILLGDAFKEVTIGMGGGQGNIYANAPFVTFFWITIISLFSIIVWAGMMGNAAYRDFELNFHSLYFSYPVKKWDYIIGRFLGNLAVMLFILSSLALGMFIGAKMPFVNPEKIGHDISILSYITPYLWVVIPNLIFTGFIFYALALTVRKRLPVYMSSVGMVMGYMLATQFINKISNEFIAVMIDPFGNYAAEYLMKYWTPAERNTLLVPFSGVLIWNRLLWMAIGILILWFGTRKFKLSYSIERKHPTVKLDTTVKDQGKVAVSIAQPIVERTFSMGLYIKQFFNLVKMEFFGIVRNVYFLAIMFTGLLFVFIIGYNSLGRLYDTLTYPVTYQVIEIIGPTFAMFFLIILAFYSGEVVWKERDKRFAQINDTLPVPGGVIYSSKIGALILVEIVMFGILMIAGIILQALKGYFNFEIGLYLKELFGIRLIGYIIWAVLAVFVHVLVNNKYQGHFVMIVFFMIRTMMPALGIEHKLLIFNRTPNYIYSDMNGYGHFLGAFSFFQIYWAGIALLIAAATQLLWVRGTETRLKVRLKKVSGNLSRGSVIVGILGLIITIGTGSFIFYNTNILHRYEKSFDREEKSAQYEKKYKKYEGLPQPRIVKVMVNADIYPSQLKAEIHGTLVLKNKTNVAIPVIHVVTNPDIKINGLDFDQPATLTSDDKDYGYRIYSLKTPLAPSAEIKLSFNMARQTEGFENDNISTEVVYNGTFFNSMMFLPHIGYAANELSDDTQRKKHNLKPKERMAKVDDMNARMNNFLSTDSDFVTFEGTLSTDKDQVAIAPGYLQKQWDEGNRRYFHYKLDTKSLNFFSFISARYELKRDKWNDVDIEIYYHKDHTYNIDRMILGVKKALEYCTANFGPYQHKLVRILEFPRFATFAQSFATTIPYSESIGFISKIEKDNIDYPFYVTAHEVAHQWWAHQVIGGNVQGSLLMSEGLAQYSALMISRHMYDDKMVRKMLTYEMDKYLIGRATEKKKEVPLSLNEGQPYLSYQKGVVAMNALADYIGEKNVNLALSRYLKATAYQEPPYTNSIEFIKYLREVTPEHLQYVITDLFETITLYENKADSATYRKLDNKKYEVTLKVNAKKILADEQGNEKEIKINDWIDIGALDKDGNAIYLEKRKIEASTASFVFVVDSEPVKAGIDPYCKLIDRETKDNVTEVKKK